MAEITNPLATQFAQRLREFCESYDRTHSFAKDLKDTYFSAGVNTVISAASNTDTIAGTQATKSDFVSAYTQAEQLDNAFTGGVSDVVNAYLAKYAASPDVPPEPPALMTRS